MEVDFDCVGKYDDIHTLDTVRFDYEGETYEAVIKKVTTLKRHQDINVVAFLTHKVT
jgi:hypothetical protein